MRWSEMLDAARTHPRAHHFPTKGIVMWKKALFVLMSLMSLALTACNTVEGAGRDVSAAGRGVSEEAREHKNY
jgi:predicted small secreted protein